MVGSQALKICFPDRERQKLYSQGEKLVRDYGQELADLIKCRLAVLRSVANLSLVPCDRLFDLKSEAGVNSYSVRLDSTHRLYFKALTMGGRKSLPAVITQIQIFGVDRPSSKKVFA